MLNIIRKTFIPCRKPDGTPTDAVLEVTVGGHVWNQLLAANGGKLPSYIIYDYENTKKEKH